MTIVIILNILAFCAILKKGGLTGEEDEDDVCGSNGFGEEKSLVPCSVRLPELHSDLDITFICSSREFFGQIFSKTERKGPGNSISNSLWGGIPLVAAFDPH